MTIIQIILSYSKLHTRKVEKSTFTMLALKVNNFEKFAVDGNADHSVVVIFDCSVERLLQVDK